MNADEHRCFLHDEAHRCSPPGINASAYAPTDSMSPVFHLRLSAFICGSICALSSNGHAQQYPNKPVRMIVISAPGGSTDILSRTLGHTMTEALGQNVVLDNKPGGGGIIATETLAKAPPDGYTILM